MNQIQIIIIINIYKFDYNIIIIINMNSNYNYKNRSLFVNKLNKIVEYVNLSRNIEKNIYNITVNFYKVYNIKCRCDN